MHTCHFVSQGDSTAEVDVEEEGLTLEMSSEEEGEKTKEPSAGGVPYAGVGREVYASYKEIYEKFVSEQPHGSRIPKGEKSGKLTFAVNLQNHTSLFINKHMFTVGEAVR